MMEPLLYSTPTYVIVTLAKGFGLSVQEYKKRFSRKERYMFFCHRIMEIEKELRSYEKAKEDQERQAATNRGLGVY